VNKFTFIHILFDVFCIILNVYEVLKPPSSIIATDWKRTTTAFFKNAPFVFH